MMTSDGEYMLYISEILLKIQVVVILNDNAGVFKQKWFKHFLPD